MAGERRGVVVAEPGEKVEPEAWAGSGDKPPEVTRHIVPRREDSRIYYQDKALCGYTWDRMGVTPDGPMCKACVREFERREGRPWTGVA